MLGKVTVEFPFHLIGSVFPVSSGCLAAATSPAPAADTNLVRCPEPTIWNRVSPMVIPVVTVVLIVAAFCIVPVVIVIPLLPGMLTFMHQGTCAQDRLGLVVPLNWIEQGAEEFHRVGTIENRGIVVVKQP